MTFADPANTFHEKAMLCRAAENTCYFASVNCASEGSGTTSAVVRPDGTLECYQPYGQEGVLVADHLFDEGYITFSSNQELVMIPEVRDKLLDAWGIDAGVRVGEFSTEQNAYLEYHRVNVFKQDRLQK